MQSKISILKIITIVAGMLAIVCAVWAQVGSYYEGLAFEKSWNSAVIFVPLMLFVIITFLTGLLIMVISVMLGNAKAKSIIPLIILPALFFTAYYLPIPNFVDGMHDAVSENLKRERLLELEAVIRSMVAKEKGRIRIDESDAILRIIGHTFHDELSLSNMPPRINISENAVMLVYGGALISHWGYAVIKTDTCPIDNLPDGRCRKVFDNVWVYHDIW